LSLSIEHIRRMGFVDALNLERIRRKKIVGVSTDSRKIRKGEIFFAIKGGKFDGHDFVRVV